MLTKLWVKFMFLRSMLFFETRSAKIAWSLVSFSMFWNLGIDFVTWRSVNISLDISALANPKLMIFWKNEKNEIDALREAASEICLKSPKQTSYGKTGIC